MKLDRRHMIAALVMLVGSILYNVWVFTRPADGVGTAAGAPTDTFTADGAAPALVPAGGQVDPSQVKPLADVALDRLPEWPRNPFVNPRPVELEIVEAGAPVPVAASDPDPVVATILYSAERRRAVIDGRIVGVGDAVGAATVVDILPDAVVLDSPEKGRLVLPLRRPGGAR